MSARLTLISHKLCPYVQRAAIVLAEKKLAFERTDIDLAKKPDWFLKISPLGKTPVLVVGDSPVFESAVICEYLDETILPRLHPEDPLKRAQHRGWNEFGSALLNAIGAFYTAPDDVSLQSRADDIRGRIEQLETQLGPDPYFSGDGFCLVDAVFAPVFRYFDVFDQIGDFGWFRSTPKVNTWRRNLALRPSVIGAAHPEYRSLLLEFLLQRGSALSRRIQIDDFSLVPTEGGTDAHR